MPPIPAALVRLAVSTIRRRGRDWAFPASGRHHRPVACWYDLAGRVLRSWPATLRVAVLLLVILTGTAELAAKIGLSGQALTIALDTWYCARQRSRRS